MDNLYHLNSYYNNLTKKKPLLYKYQYVLDFVGNGGFWVDQDFKPFTLFNDNTDDPSQNFSYWAQSASIPGFNINKTDVNFYGAKFHVPACKTYEHDFSTNILLDQDMTMYKKLDTWLKMISRYEISGGGIKTIPTCKLRIKLLDSEHQYFTTSIVMDGAYITSLAAAQFEYSGPDVGPLTVAATFKIQYYYRDDDLDLTMDPLSQAKVLAAYS